MTPLFDKNKHRLSEGEKELLWRRITDPREKARRRPWFGRLAISAGFVLATLLVVIQLQDPLPEIPEESLLFGRGVPELVPVEKQGDEEVPMQDLKLGARLEPLTVEKAAAPAQPDATPSVAPPSSGGRESAAGEVAEKSGPLFEVETIVVEGDAPLVDVQSSSVGAPQKWGKVRAMKGGSSVKGGERHVRGGRSGPVNYNIGEVPPRDYHEHRLRPVHRRGHCWVPPYYREPNGRPFEDMYFEHYGTNPFLVTDEDALSTFALDVDRASYTLTRSYIERGELPPKDAVRVEEFVNNFDAGYPSVTKGDFAIRVDGAPSPYGHGYHLLRVGLQAREIPARERKPANLVFVIDTSGSMAREDRLELVKRALLILLDELRDSDTVGIVAYGSRAWNVLPPTSVEERGRIEDALRRLHPSGSTNAEEGLELGYDMASRIYSRRTLNRLVLCSDGVANRGATEAEKILDRVRLASDRGISLSTVGFGMGNYNDVLMEKLANQGDGNYHYVDDLDEARRVFCEDLTGTLQTLARDAKVQVEFDPETVLRYRLIGYENRAVADEDFRNDAVDAGEIGPGHTVTALYEIKLSHEAAEEFATLRLRRTSILGTVRLRYEKPEHSAEAGEIVEMERSIELGSFVSDFDEAEPAFRLAATVAEFAEVLRHSYWARGGSLAELVEPAAEAASALRGDVEARDFARLVRDAARIQERER